MRTRPRLTAFGWSAGTGQGAGRSPVQPGRTLLDVVADTRAVADHLGVEAVRVAGLSGGGSHVLALAAAGGPLVRGVVAVNPGPPAEEDILAELPESGRPASCASPVTVRRSSPSSPRSSQYRGKGKVAEILESMRMRGQHPADVEVLHRPEVYDAFRAAAVEGGRQPRAYTNEALIIWNQPWGVSLDTFPVPVDVFTGDGDLFRPFAERPLPGRSDLHVFPGGHVSGFVPEVMNQVVALLRS